MDRRVVLPGVLGIHLAVAIAHGATHASIPVALPPWQNALVVGTVFVGPIVGVALDRRGHALGLPLFTVTMAGAVLLSVVLHFLVANPDHVRAIPDGPWRLPFRVSAVGVAIVPAWATAVGAWYWRTR